MAVTASFTSASTTIAQTTPTVSGGAQAQLLSLVEPQITTTPQSTYYTYGGVYSEENSLAQGDIQQAWANEPTTQVQAPIVAIIDSGADPNVDLGSRLLPQINLYPTNSAPIWVQPGQEVWTPGTGAAALDTDNAGTYDEVSATVFTVIVGLGGSGSYTPFTWTASGLYPQSGSGTATNGQAASVNSNGITITFAAGTTYSAGVQYSMTAGLDEQNAGTYNGTLIGAALNYTLTVASGGTTTSTPFTYTSTDPSDPSGSGTATNGQVTPVGTTSLSIVFPSGDQYSAGLQFIVRGANDDIGHGTYVAQLIAGGISSGNLSTGVCPQCDVLPVRVGGYFPGTSGEDFSTFTIAQGIIDAANYPGVQVINLSLGAASDPPDSLLSCPDASSLGAMQCAIDYAISNGITVVAAGGNYNSSNPLYPAYTTGVLSVAGIDQSNTIEPWSNHDGSGENWVDVAAPGCYITDEYAVEGDNVPATFCGTSAASPYVAGEAALLYMADPSITPAQVLSTIEQTATNPIYQIWQDHGDALGLGTQQAGTYTGSTPYATYTVTVGAGATESSTPFIYTSTDPLDPSGSGVATNGVAGPVGLYGLTIDFYPYYAYSAGSQYTSTAGLVNCGTVNANLAVQGAETLGGTVPTTTTTSTTVPTTTTSTTVPTTTTSTTSTTVPSTTTSTVATTTTSTTVPTTTTSTTSTTVPSTTTSTVATTTSTTVPSTTTSTTLPSTTTTVVSATTTSTVPTTTTSTVVTPTTSTTVPTNTTSTIPPGGGGGFGGGGSGGGLPPLFPTTTVFSGTTTSVFSGTTTTVPAPTTTSTTAPAGSGAKGTAANPYVLPSNIQTATRSSGSGVSAAADPTGPGYWTVTANGTVTGYDGAPDLGSATGKTLHNEPVAGITPTTNGHGYWLYTKNGEVLAFGDAHLYKPAGQTDHGQMAGLEPASQMNHGQITGLEPASNNKGYWLVTNTGNVSAYGDAAVLGSIHLNTRTVVGMAATPDSHGYWVVTAAGKVYRFGDAKPYRMNGAQPISAKVIGIVATPDGNGYWLLLRNGQAVGSGDAS